MSSFQRNNATRAGKKARIEGVRYGNVLDTVGPIAGRNFQDNQGRTSHSRPRNTTKTIALGDATSTGITIYGNQEPRGFPYPTNPNEQTIKLSETGVSNTYEDTDGYFPDDVIAQPAFPINFAGRGYLKFTTPVAIPSIRGKVVVNGDLHVMGDLTAEHFFATNHYTTVTMGDDGGADFFTGVTSSVMTHNVGSMKFVSGRVAWTGKGTANGAMVLAAMPEGTTVPHPHLNILANSGVVSTQIGADVYLAQGATSGEWNFMEAPPHHTDVPTPLQHLNFSTSGYIEFNGFI